MCSTFEMFFCAGFMGVGQDRTSLTIQPVIGWVVVDSLGEKIDSIRDSILS